VHLPPSATSNRHWDSLYARTNKEKKEGIGQQPTKKRGPKQVTQAKKRKPPLPDNKSGSENASLSVMQRKGTENNGF
jgi:hypothetical protein